MSTAVSVTEPVARPEAEEKPKRRRRKKKKDAAEDSKPDIQDSNPNDGMGDAKDIGWGHVHREDHDTEDEDEYDDYDEKKFYFLFMFGGGWLYCTLVAVSSAAHSWAHSDTGVPHSVIRFNSTSGAHELYNTSVPTVHGSIPSNDYYNMWVHCHCYPTTEEKCPIIANFFLGGKIVSLLSLSGELLVILLHALMYSGFMRRLHRCLNWTSCFISGVVTVLLLGSFVTFSAAYARTWCGEKVRERGFVSWLYGLRICEFITMLIITIGATYQAKRRSKRFAKTIMWVVFCCFIAGIVSTMARAWIQNVDGGHEVGLWEACECWIHDRDCNEETSYFEAMAAFAIMSLLSMGLFLASYFLHISKKTQMPCLCCSLLFSVIEICVFAAWYPAEFCGGASAQDRQYSVSWAVYLLITAIVTNMLMIANLSYRWCHAVV